MILKEPQCMRKNLQGQHLLPICCLYLNTFVQVLHSKVQRTGNVSWCVVMGLMRSEFTG